MNFFSRIGQAIRAVSTRVKGAIGERFGRIRQARQRPPKPPRGYKPETPTVDKLPEQKPPENIDYDAQKWAEYEQYKSQLTNLTSYFDFDEDVVQQIAYMELDLFDSDEVDWLRLNSAIEQLQKYLEVYAAGTREPDYDYYINEINMSIPGLNLTKSTSENWLTIGL